MNEINNKRCLDYLKHLTEQRELGKYVKTTIKQENEKENLFKGNIHYGIIDSVIDSYSANVFVDGSATSQEIPTNPNIHFIAGEQVFVEFINNESSNKFVRGKCATGTEQAGNAVVYKAGAFTAGELPLGTYGIDTTNHRLYVKYPNNTVKYCSLI